MEVELDGETHSSDLAGRPDVGRSSLLARAVSTYRISAGRASVEHARVRSERGRVRMMTDGLLDSQLLADGHALGCQALPDSDDIKIVFCKRAIKSALEASVVFNSFSCSSNAARFLMDNIETNVETLPFRLLAEAFDGGFLVRPSDGNQFGREPPSLRSQRSSFQRPRISTAALTNDEIPPFAERRSDAIASRRRRA